MTNKLIITASLALTLAACATPPKPVVQAPAPEPVAEIPAPRPVAPAPVQRQQAETLPPPVTQNLNLPIPGSAEDFVYQSGGDARVYFAYNQYDLSQTARDTLRRQANWLNSYPQVAAVIEGNADERGTREYNLALGARRAESVKGFLVSQGVAPSRLTTVSYGKERPIDAGSNESAWARNRNGHTSLMRGTIG